MIGAHVDSASRTPTAPTGEVKIEVCRRLLADWQDLADYFDIPADQRRSFTRGREPQGVWEWLEARSRLPALAEALAYIGRVDLVEVLQRHPR